MLAERTSLDVQTVISQRSREGNIGSGPEVVLFSRGSRRGPSEDKAREGQRPPVSEER